ncbi:MAG: lamin tail domain-containing protein [Patescibacteria group bacterium]|nr:lamin tail domain-containing protein [Patescibacteria group bacterium]MDD5715889.1 lamin tail domain-containing protein [Patescibacteria group bacterium]
MKKFLFVLIAMLFAWPFISDAITVDHIVISEVQITGGSGKTTDEFIELYNPMDGAVSVDGWQLIKKTASGTEYILVDTFGDRSIPAHSFVLVAHPAGYLGSVQPDLYYSTTTSIADNNTVLLLDAAAEVVDAVGFGTASVFEGAALPNPGPNKSVERKAQADSTAETMVEGGAHYYLGNGEDTDQNAADFNIRDVSEPQDAASEQEYLNIEVPDEPEAPDDPAEPSEPPAPPASPAYSTAIALSELLPNPEGSDDAEFIELANTGTTPVDVAGWQAGDQSTRRYTIVKEDFSTTIIPGGGFFTISKSVSGIMLNNSTDGVTLYQPNGNALDSVTYAGCAEGRSYSLVDGEWAWSYQPTPGEANIFTVSNQQPEAIISIDKESPKVGQPVQFSAADSDDPDGDSLEYIWNFGDGGDGNGVEIEYSYPKAGKYTVTLLVQDGNGGESEVEEPVTVTDFDYSNDVIFSELFPNCTGPDQECEFIELYNAGSRDVSLDCWQVTDSKVYFSFPPGSKIAAHDYFLLERAESRISLNNDRETVYLIDPHGGIINGVSYETAKEGLSFARTASSDGWYWTDEPTPGAENADALEEEAETEERSVKKTATPVSSSAVDEREDGANGSAPKRVGIGDINEAMIGDLITISGEVESVSGRSVYIVDSQGNSIRAYIQAKTGMAKPDVTAGAGITITGVLDKTDAGLRILPRGEGDIAIAPEAATTREGTVLGTSTEGTVELPQNIPEQPSSVPVIVIASVGAAAGVGFALRWYILKKKNAQQS